MTSNNPWGADSAAFPSSHPKLSDPEITQYHIGLTKLEMFTLAAMLDPAISARSAVERATSMLRELQTRCPSCLEHRAQLDAEGQTYYVCMERDCAAFGINDALKKDHPELHKKTLGVLEKLR